MTDSNSAVARAAFRSFRAQDLAAAAPLYADDFRFTSPQDDHLDRDAFFERCFPTADRMASQELLHVVPVDEEVVFVQYEYVLKDGGRYRNVEAITIRDGLIHEVQVFFGGAL